MTRGLARLRLPQSVRVRITIVATVVTMVAVFVGGWVLIRSVESSQRGEIQSDNEDLYDKLADALRAGTEPECLPSAVDPGDLGTAQVRVVDDEGIPFSFATGYTGEGGGVTVLEQMNGGRTSGQEASESGPATAASCCQDVSETQGDAEGPPCASRAPSPESDDGDVQPEAEDGGAQDEGRPIEQAWLDADIESISGTVTNADGEFTLTVVTPVDQVTEAVNAVRTALLLGLPLVVSLVALASWLLVGRALRPAEAIRSEAEAIGGRTLDRRVPEPDSGDEIGRLARTMNAMLDRLEASAERQRQFIADASHELRTPLSAIRTELEVALIEGDRADWRAAVKASLKEESRLEALIADLLILAREDESAIAPPASPVDLAALAQEEAGRSRRVPATVTAIGASSGITVPGRSRDLRQVLSNLMDNASRHARREVRVRICRTAHHVELTVDDDGPGIAVADRERAFERFTRLDDSRARDHGGAGLGLAVVRSIVNRHGGAVYLETSNLGGARFVVTLPAGAPGQSTVP